jgi:hypothetical protein
VRAKAVTSGEVHGKVSAKVVEEGGSVTGVDVDRIG